MCLPKAIHVCLGYREALADDFQHVARALLHPMRAEEDRRHAIGTHIFQWFGRYGMAEEAIYHQSAANTHGKKDAGISAAGAHGID